jgi:Ni/Fe-hydrogenase subunit HybB-like protein
MTSELIDKTHTFSSATEKIAGVALTRRTPRAWLLGFTAAFGLLMLLVLAVAWLFAKGVGIWGVNVPVAWGFAIINFVWWIGIGHAGTLISAILLLFRQKWRNAISRFAEAMTLFAVACAGLFPILHLGRPEYFYWLVPYPNTMSLWPQFKSPLVWDVFAITTYGTVSLLFWYVGLIPDLAAMRDRARHPAVKVAYGVPALGWRGSAEQWKHYEKATLLLAGLATPLVISVHTIVSYDFAVSILPGWHSTIFPPYFVAGAVYSGFAMVLTLVIPLRAYYRLDDFITMKHLDVMAKVMLATGLIVAYSYVVEIFTAFYSGSQYEAYAFVNRMTGPYGMFFWMLIAFNVLIPQFLWLPRARNSPLLLFFIAIAVNAGMWLERFVIVVTSLHRDFLPSSWGLYSPTVWDWATYAGTIGLFLTLLFLFVRVLPMISIFEMRELLAEEERSHD